MATGAPEAESPNMVALRSWSLVVVVGGWSKRVPVKTDVEYRFKIVATLSEAVVREVPLSTERKWFYE